MGIEICAADSICSPMFHAQGGCLKTVELRILELHKNGMSKSEIADELALSPAEVSKRLKAIERKVNFQRDAAENRRVESDQG